MTVLKVFVRASVLAVRIELGPPEHAGVLEGLVMEAVARGVDHIDDLADVFALPPRMMLDLLSDLWRAERITVDFGAVREAITLTAKGQKDLATGKQRDGVESSRRPSTTSEVLLDPLVGRILPLRQRTGWVDRALIVPLGDDDAAVAEVRPADLAPALRRNLESEAGSDLTQVRGLKIVAAHLVPRLISDQVEQRIVAIEIAVVIGDLDELRIEVTDEDLSIDQRESATRRLQALVESAPQSAFARSLRGRASHHLDPPRSIDDQVHELRRAAVASSETVPANRQAAHDQLSQMATRLIDHVRTLAQREMPVTVLADGADHQSAIIGMVDRATLQIVMAVPWVSLPGMRPYLEALRSAVRRGVRITLLWGVRSDGETLAERVLHELADLRQIAEVAGRGGAIRFHPEHPANTHAKVIVVDDREALVTSKNFFSSSENGELGLKIEARKGWAAPVIEDLLRWAHDIAPDQELALQIIRDRDAFGSRELEPVLELPTIPRFHKVLTTAAPDYPAVGQWAGAWREVAEQVARLLVRPLPVVRAMTDGMHPSLLREAIRGSSQRLLVTSDKLSPRVVSLDLIKRLEGVTGRGASTTLIYHQGGPDQDLHNQIVEALLASDVTLIHDAKNHAKVIVTDEVSIVGSYNFLSLDADFRRRRFSGELSLHVHSAALSNEVAGHFGIPPLSIPATDEVGTDSSNAYVVAAAISDRVRSGGHDAAGLLELARRGAFTEVLDVLRSTGDIGAYELVLAAAIESDSTTGTEHVDVISALCDSAWSRRDWALADVLRDAMPDAAHRPRKLLTAVVAAEAGAHADRVFESLIADSSEAEAEAIALHALLVRANTGDYTLDDGIQELLPRLSDPAIADLVGEALSYAREFGTIPRAALRAHRARQENTDILQGLWDRLDVAVARLRQYDPGTPPGWAARAQMFAPGNDMHELEQIVSARDAPRLGAWHAEHGAITDSRWIDDTTRRAKSAQVDGRRRESFGSKRAAVRVAVTAILAAFDPGQAMMGDLKLRHPALDRMRARARTALDSALSRPDSPERLVVVDALEQLVDLESETGAKVASLRFPRLLVADLDGQELTPSDRARRAATDFATVRSPGDEVVVLADLGEFALAEQALDSEPVRFGDRVDDLRAVLVNARLAAREALAIDEIRIRIEAERSELPEPKFPWRGDDSPDRMVVVTRLVKTIEQELESARVDRAAGIQATLDQLESITPRWRAHIGELIAEGELSAAAEALKTNDGAVKTASRGFTPWPLRNSTLTQVAHYFTVPEDRPNSVNSFEPDPSDTAAIRVIEAIRGLDRSEPGSRSDEEREYVAAVQGLVFATDGDPEIQGDDSARTVTFVIPSPGELPRLAWAAQGFSVTVALDANVTDALFRISFAMNESLAPGAVLDVSDVLSLLRTDGPGHRMDDRRMNLIRLISSKLPFESVVDSQTLRVIDDVHSRNELRWLLFVLAIDLDMLSFGVLVAMAGPHPAVLRVLIERLLDLRQSDHPVRELRRDPTLGDLMVAAVLDEDLQTDSARLTLAVLAIAGSSGADVALLGQLGEEAMSSTTRYPAATVPPFSATTTIETELESLVRSRYVTRTAAGYYQLTSDVVGRALLHHDFDAALDRIVTALIDTHRHGDISTEISTSVERLLRHNQIDDYAARIDNAVLREKLMSSDVESDVRFFAFEAAKYWQNDTVTVVNDPVETAFVAGPPGRTLAMLDTLMSNARAAAEKRHPDGGGTIRVGVHVEGNDIVLVVADNGDGIPDESIDELRRGRAPKSTKRAGEGEGLALVHEVVALIGGTVLLDRDPHLTGARVTLTLPQVPPPATEVL